MDVWAKNSKGEKRKFTEVCWKLLSSNTEGWELMPDHIIHDVTVKTQLAKPATGEKTKTVEQKIENVSDKKVIEQQILEPKKENVVIEKIFSEQEKTLFLQTANGIKAGAIKDYFETQNIDFKAGAKYTELLNLLGEKLNFDITEFQKAFGK